MTPQIFSSAKREFYGSAHDRADLCEQWLSFVGQSVYTYSLEGRTPQGPGFQVRARARFAEGFTLLRGTTSQGQCRLRRDAAEIGGDGRDCYGLHMLLRGAMQVSQFGRVQHLRPGSYALISAGDPNVYVKGDDNDMISFFVPREFIEQRVMNAEDLCARTHRQGHGLSGLVFETVKAFEQHAWEITDEEFQSSARVVADLMLLALKSAVDLPVHERSVRISNLARLKRIMRNRLADSELTLADIAREAGLSLSYSHELFRAEGRTMREYLNTERLHKARELLELRSERDISVTDIALGCGFSNPSYFSTAFKRAFGVSPRDVMRHKVDA